MWKKYRSLLQPSHSVNKGNMSYTLADIAVFLTDLEIKSTCEESVNVTVFPDECCLVIEKGDIDCGVSIVCLGQCYSNAHAGP